MSGLVAEAALQTRGGNVTGPHQERQLVTAGAPLSVAEAAAVLLHGRGATAEGIVRLAEEFYRHGLAFLAPSAERDRWFPESFLAPVEANEPWFSSALRTVGDALAAASDAGIPADRTLLFGVSQGACVASEYAVRRPTRFGGVAVSSGGLVGPEVTPGDLDGSLAGTPVLVGGSTRDPRVPIERLRATAAAFEALDGAVTEQFDDAAGHGITDAELRIVEEMVAGLLDSESAEGRQ